MNVIAVLAQVASDYPALYTYGPMGIITAWMMWRDEKRQIQVRESEDKQAEQNRDIMHRIDGLSRALLLREIDSDNPYIREHARSAMAKIDARAAKDEKDKAP